MNLLDHIGNARSLIYYQNLAAPALAGDRSDPFAAIHQVLLVDTVLSVLGITLKAFQRGPVPLLVRGICYLTPVMLGATIAKPIQSDRARRALIWAQDAIGPLCQLAFVVCLAVAAYFGVATVTLTLANSLPLVFASLQFFEQRNWLGQWLGEKVRGLWSVIDCLCFISSTSWLSRGIGALSLLGVAMKARSDSAPKAKKPIDNALKLADLKRLIPFWEREKGSNRVGTINREYIHFETLPPANPKIRLDAFNELLQRKMTGFSREELFRIRTLLSDDEKFTQQLGNPFKLTDKRLLEFIRDAGVQFIGQIKSRSIGVDEEEGKLSDQAYGTLEHHIRLCIEYLIRLDRSDPTHIRVTDSLLILAIRGRYCAAEKVNIAEDMAYSLALGCEYRSLASNLLGLLRIERVHISDQVLSSARIIFGPLRLHTVNLLRSAHPDFGCQKAALDADEQVSQPLSILFRALLGPKLLDTMFEGHTPQVAVRAIREATGHEAPGALRASLTWNAIGEWWEKWIEKQGCPAAEKRQMKESLEHWQILGCNLQDEGGKLNPTIALAMLTAIGVIIPPADV